MCQEYPTSELGLDEGIFEAVKILRDNNVFTVTSCEGGEDHAFPEPIIVFHGQHEEGFRVFAVAMENGLPVKELRRIWDVVDNEPTGPLWALTFWKFDGVIKRA